MVKIKMMREQIARSLEKKRENGRRMIIIIIIREDKKILTSFCDYIL